MCWHKWGKWSEPFEVEYFYTVYGIILDNNKRIVKLKQKRVCTKCGKYQEKTIQGE